MRAIRPVAALALIVLAASARDRPAALPIVEANDNRTPAGTLKDGTLELDLVVQMARWYPEEKDGPFAEVAAFGEEGKPPQIPGPLIRVPEGTTIVARVRNALPDSVIWLRSMITRPAARDDSVAIRPGETKTVRFLAGAPGTYLYHATQGTYHPRPRAGESVSPEREQLAGVLVIDSAGARTDDRIFMVNIWGGVDSVIHRNAVAINGRSWPYTERIAANVGDTLRWRVINASVRAHPMHLHGFYFTVNSRGSYLADTVLGAKQRLAVTENMPHRTTMSMHWTPDRPGNWLFHCHVAFHVLESARLDAPHEVHHHAKDPIKHMAGLVMGITVRDPKGLAAKPTGPVRRLRLFANERPRVGRTPMRMSYVLQTGARAPAVDSVEPPGGLILLQRNEPTEITVVNRTHASTSVHWHGLELESYSDGVAGWSGADMKVAPMIAPGDSFTARLTMPRSGTFIYHTHLNDVEQLTSGAYGPIVVVDQRRKFNPEVDHVFTLGWEGRPPKIAINGDTLGTVPLELKSGRTHRLRFVNIGAGGPATFAVRQDTVPVEWRPVAKDGADLPPALRTAGRASRTLVTGETFDAEWKPEPGVYRLTVSFQTQLYSRLVVLR